ncbi:hypothetical protein RQN30_07510 [Arcanobacterium hippocoleae]
MVNTENQSGKIPFRMQLDTEKVSADTAEYRIPANTRLNGEARHKKK